MVWHRPTWLTCVSPFRPSSAGGRQRDTRRAAFKDYDRSATLRRVRPGDMEQLSRRTAEFNCVHRDIRKKTQKSSLWLLAPLRTLSNWRRVNSRIHLCIHSSCCVAVLQASAGSDESMSTVVSEVSSSAAGQTSRARLQVTIPIICRTM